MKRVLLIGMILTFALGVFVAPAVAVPAADVTALADYYPADTAVVLGLRTDDAFVDELDSLVGTLRAALPPGMLPPFTLRVALDEAVADMGGERATFDNTLRTWLGDTMAVGFLDFEDAMTGRSSDPSLLVAFEIADRQTALKFIQASYAQNGVEVDVEEAGDFTLVTPEHPSNAFFALGNDVLLLSNEAELLPLNSDFRSLGNDADFASSISSLPASDYNIVVALNLRDMVRMSYDMMMMMGDEMGPAADMMAGLEALYADYPRQTLGLTILDGRSLTIDFVQGGIDFAALEGSFFESAAPLLNAAAVDFDFASHIPADAPFAVQGTGFGDTVTYMIDVLAFVGEMGVQQSLMQSRFNGAGRDDVPAMIEEMDANDIRAFIDLAFAGMTGLNLQDDVLPYFNGNFATYGRVLPSEATDFTFDAALVFEVTDAAATQTIMDRLVYALERYEADFAYEDGMLVLPGVIRGMLPERYQEDIDAEAVFDFLIGVNDDVFAIGSRAAVEFALNGDGDSLADDAAFVDARSLFLEGSQQVGYVGFGTVRTLIADVLAAMDEDAAEMSEMDALLMVLDALSSASYSARFNDDGSSVGRLVLTLAG